MRTVRKSAGIWQKMRPEGQLETCSYKAWKPIVGSLDLVLKPSDLYFTGSLGLLDRDLNTRKKE
jgi:hypothetical protein